MKPDKFYQLVKRWPHWSRENHRKRKERWRILRRMDKYIGICEEELATQNHPLDVVSISP